MRGEINKITERLQLIFEWYKGIIDEETGRLAYIYHPKDHAFLKDGSPIREIASVWDVEILSDFLKRQDLQPLIHHSVTDYSHYLARRDGYLILE
jgi:hypothetical protein